MTKILLLLVLLFVTPSFAQEIQAIQENKKGVAQVTQVLEKLKSLQEEAQKTARPGTKPPEVKLNPDDLNPAFNHFLMAGGLMPEQLVYRFNLALVHLMQNQLDKSVIEFEQVATKADGDLKFFALFNLGILKTQLKDIDQALQYYQQALEIRPESVEVKTNIELLWQQNQGEGGGEGNEQKDQQGQGDSKKDGQDKKDNPDKRNNEGELKGGDKSTEGPKQPRELSEEEVQKILNELKNQEQKIRAKELDQNVKEKPLDKDW